MKRFVAVFAVAFAVVLFGADIVSFKPVATGDEFKLSRGGKLTRVEAFSPVSGGTFAISSIYSADTYTNAVQVANLTNTTYSVVTSNDYTHVVATNVYSSLSFVDDPGIIGISTNMTYYAVTNRWPVYKGTVAVTNSLATGTQSGYTVGKALDTPVYLAPGERIRFTGTGVGGFIRLIFE